MANPLKGWKVDPAEIRTVGRDLRRPECVLAEPTGDLWVADLRGGVLRIRPDGGQEIIRPRNGGGPFAPELDSPNIDGNQGFSMPNGLCFDAQGDFVIANFGTDRLERLTRTGEWSLLLGDIQGAPLGKANFPAFDSKGRLWFSVTASAEAWRNRGPQTPPDGYIALMDQAGVRVVARGLRGTNEIRFDDEEQWLYVAETGAGHISRFPVIADGRLGPKEIYGPDHLGGRPDGFAFDAYGNLWTTLIDQDRLVAITPEGDVLVLWEDGDRDAKAGALQDAARSGQGHSLAATGGDGLAPRMASITFAGLDLRTVHIGSLQGRTLPTFHSPVPGRPLAHWRSASLS